MKIPEVIYIETTNKCNANCIMCPHDKMKRPLETMDEDIFRRIVISMKESDLSNTQLFLHKEGEPLCDENIISRITFANRELPNLKEMGINTNAMLLTKEKSDLLLESGINLVFFSVDGVCADTYEKIRLNCKYDIVEKNIEYFLISRKKKNKNIRVVMQMLLTDFNKHEKQEFINKWGKYDVEFYFKKMHCYLDGNKSSFKTPDFTRQMKVCDDPFRLLVYYVNGNVGCCCWDYNNEYVIGNAREQDMLELFNNNNIEHMRMKQKGMDCGSVSPCNRCGRIYGEDKISEY